MSSDATIPGPEAKDGFDLIEYPCDFAFKAMCRADPMQSALDHIQDLISPLVTAEALLDMQSNESRTGKFESVTAKVRLESRDQLESIYLIIGQSKRVVMTL
ncbi:hypothetical protein GCM10008090_27280 [Arenicella chitinivorans]|uniref:Uncharacterized protein n=1 Tax=Arenicella chitinivorans TaxID=1329800 RepID=A0A918RY61_9GAMM|nr:DUF493 domain-containing protein [Arenicella chitinivorans]GHA16053.1 hypothetical protein GCM10008090_27280 [Arenicella chitinivorans]